MICDTAKQYSRACSGFMRRRASSRRSSAIKCGGRLMTGARHTHRQITNAEATRIKITAAITLRSHGFGTCLGCRMSRMSSLAEAAGEATPAAGARAALPGNTFVAVLAAAGTEFVSAVAFATANSRVNATALVKTVIMVRAVF